MKSAYRQDYQPAFSAVEIILANREEGLRSDLLSALLDSGSDGTLVPIAYLKDLLVAPLHDAFIRSHWGERRSVQLFLVDLEIGETRLPGVFVIGDDQGGEIVLGRNVLNKLVVLMDGLAEQVSLQ
ncbi:MAG: hypothetical protein AB1894_04295 [Chloroflexota bacterium]